MKLNSSFNSISSILNHHLNQENMNLKIISDTLYLMYNLLNFRNLFTPSFFAPSLQTPSLFAPFKIEVKDSKIEYPYHLSSYLKKQKDNEEHKNYFSLINNYLIPLLTCQYLFQFNSFLDLHSNGEESKSHQKKVSKLEKQNSKIVKKFFDLLEKNFTEKNFAEFLKFEWNGNFHSILNYDDIHGGSCQVALWDVVTSYFPVLSSFADSSQKKIISRLVFHFTPFQSFSLSNPSHYSLYSITSQFLGIFSYF